MEHAEPHHHLKLIVWTVSVVFFIALLAAIFLILMPKSLVVAGTLKTKEGPVKAGEYDFRLKFYNATTRTDLVYSYDAKGVTVDERGKFSASLPDGGALHVATLMQVCIASPDSAVPGTITGGQAILPSCEVPEVETDQAAYNQTICGLTAVDQDPTNTINWLASKNVVYATPTKACGQSDEGIASVSDEDTVAPLIEAPGTLSELLESGVNLEPGTLLTIGQDGQLTASTPSEAVGAVIEEEIAANEAENPSVTNVFNTYPTTVIENGINTAPQTLSLNGSVLSISSGNSVTLPSSGSSGDDVIGNEVTDIIAGDGLVRVGTGTTLDPFKVGLITCASGQVLKSSGSLAWSCAADAGTTYSAGTGISLAGTTINANIGSGLSVNGSNQIINSGVLSVGGTGPVTSTGGQNPTIAFANGSATGQFWQWDGDSWELATLPTDGDGVVGNEVVGATGSNSGLVRSGAGTSVSPYTLAVSVSSGLQLLSGNVAIDSPTCSGTDKLQWNGTAFICSADANTTYSAGNGISLAGTTFSVNSPTCAGTTKLQWNSTAFVCSTDIDAQTLGWVDGTRTLSISNGNSVVIADADTTYSALTNGGLRLAGTAFALKTCTTNQILKAQATSGEWDCAADNDTTYSAGTGLSLAGTTFNNTGVLGVTASGALTSTGGQNPNISFANGSATGQFWQWDGDSWELASLAVDGDSVIGNEVTNVTGSNSGLTRSGSGTAIDPYTLAVSVGNGLQLTSGSIAINSPTCSGTTKLQWSGTAFSCSADVDTTNFSITDGTTTQSVAATQAITFAGSASSKTTVTLGGSRQLTFGLDTAGASSGQVLTYNGTNLAWQSPTTYAPTSCSATSTYICQDGNTLGGAITLGTNDAFALNFETGGSTAVTILANGQVGIGDTTPAQALEVNGNIAMPITSSSAGILMINSARTLHAYGGISNIYVGQNSGNFTHSGTFNSGIGSQTLMNVTSGSFNTAASANGLFNTTTGSSNSAVGIQSLFGNTTGSDNTAIGHNAGYTGTAGAFANTTGNFNTFIGSLSGPGSATQLTNATAIGAYATVAQSNSVILGCVSGVVSCPQTQTVGIGNSAPGFLLHVGSATSMPSGATVTRFENGGGTCSVIPSTAGGVTCTSDERAKKNIEAFTGAVELLERINIKKYNMKSDKSGSTKQIGVIAQEVEDVLPGLVVTDADGAKSFSYAGLTPILLQAIKEQQVQLDHINAGVWSGGIVSKDATFKAQAIFEGPARFVGEASFKGDVSISGKVKLSHDQVNTVILPKGKKSIHILFGGAYGVPPYITATPRDFLQSDSQYRVTNVFRTGFTIEVNKAQAKAIQFDWHAFSN
ncbi:MAG TPA: tail fiber domain-containing protein [Candidatus Saccharimonadales bacterium]